MSDTGVVVIGRDEGARLRRGLGPLLGLGVPVVYVDSGSTDGSPEWVESQGGEVVRLEADRPFTAGRARNAGVDRLDKIAPGLVFTQFVDGDCQLESGWIEEAAGYLRDHRAVGIVCGQLRERDVRASVFKRLLAIEWDRPPGRVEACGGIFAVRLEAFRRAGGFDETIGAGEEPELCLRVRSAGYEVIRLERPMATHDLARLTLGCWWTRQARGATGAMDLVTRFGMNRYRYSLRSARRWTLGWLALSVTAVLTGAWFGEGWGWAALALSVLAPLAQVARIAVRNRDHGHAWTDSILEGVFGVLGKWPQLLGQLSYGALGGPQTNSERSVAYLVNQYPTVSHAFIRREILALEEAGMLVARFAIRPHADDLVDESDRAERDRTRVILAAGPAGLVLGAIGTLLRHPIRACVALGVACRLGMGSDRGLMRWLAYWVEASLLRGWLAACGTIHLHAHFGTNPAAVAMLCERMGGAGYSFTLHGNAEYQGMPRNRVAEKARHARFVVVVSEDGRDWLTRYCDASDHEKIRLIHCGLERKDLETPTTPIPDRPRLVCVGRLSPEKGQRRLVESVALLRRRGVELELALVGDGPDREDLQAEIDRLGLGNTVRLEGWADSADVRSHFDRSRAAVLASDSEGMPLVLKEAMAMGRPVIATRVGGVSELVREGENGWIVEPGDAAALTEAMEEAVSLDTDTMSSMGRAGRDRVRSEHRADVAASKLARLFEGFVTRME